MNEKTNFWEVISNYFIEIPILQRDYAQGRITNKVNEIRNKIISDCHNALTQNETLEFDFVYGNIEIRDNEKIFIPLDGQQRLTTLFLLHWYLAINEKELTGVKILQKFSYKTRISSRDFCRDLIGKSNELPTLSSEQNIRDIIKNQSWFFISWEKDPTVSAMLNTLEDIHKKFCGTEGLLRKINSTESPIIFRFIELKEFGLEDDLYIKMNSRGKALTDFENFKAKFEQYIEKHYPDEIPSFLHKIDGKWTDLFWEIGQTTSFDENFLNFFRAVAANSVARQIDTSSGKKPTSSPLAFPTVQAIIEQIDELSIQNVKALDCLDLVKNIEFTKGKTKIFDLFKQITSSVNPPYRSRILFHAVLLYLSNSGKEGATSSLSEWLRIIYNLTQNTEYDEISEFTRSIKMVESLTPRFTTILTYISEHTNAQSISGFNKAQIEEESIKASLILKSEEWKTVIYEAETHPYFNGQIGFLLFFAGITTAYKDLSISNWDNAQSKSYLNAFNEYRKKMEIIFGENGVTTKNLLWERALLSKGFYWIEKGDRCCLLQNNTHRDYSWKRLLRDSSRWSMVKDVLDEVNVADIDNDLQKIINKSRIDDLRRYIIDDHRVMSSCQNRFIHKYKDTYLLLNTSTTGGYHKELRSYVLYLRILDVLTQKIPNNQTLYSMQCGIDSKKAISKINGIDIQISYSSGSFAINYLDEEFQQKNEDDVISFLREKKIII